MKNPFKKTAPPAQWPHGKELLYHLDLVPYLKVHFPFDHQACFREASALLERFVNHRNYNQSSLPEKGGRWKSLAIRAINGDPTKTQYHRDYGVTEPEYRMTEIAELCPHTVDFLHRITEPEKCERIRFMLLEPGARIHAHSDGPDRDVCLSTNIALNMPAGCDFFIGANPDGTHNPYTRKIPFEPGDVMMVNIAKYHHLVNDSDENRIHIIISGPTRFTPEDLLAAARAQNGALDERPLVPQLVQKKVFVGEPLDRTPSLMADWKVTGIGPESILDQVRVVVVDDPLPSAQLRQDCLDHITRASLFPAAYDVVAPAALDAHLAALSPEKYEFALVAATGSWFPSLMELMLEAMRTCATLRASGSPVMGHLMDWKDGRGELPFLHEQFALVDLRKWRALGCPAFGSPYSGEKAAFPAYAPSADNVHDDYTPLTLRPSADAARAPTGRKGFGTDVLAAALRAGITVPNLPMALRTRKKFAYPRDRELWQYRELEQEIAKVTTEIGNEVFYFNNEWLRGTEIPGFAPRHFLTVASGLKPLVLLDQYFRKAPERITVLDHSERALRYLQGIATCRSPDELVHWIWRFGSEETPDRLQSIDFVKSRVDQVIETQFGREPSRLADALRKLGTTNVEWVKGDFISEPEVVTSRLQNGCPFLFWHSNAWISNVSLYFRTEAALSENYSTLARRIGAATGARPSRKAAWFESAYTSDDGTLQGYLLDHTPPGTVFSPTTFSALA